MARLPSSPISWSAGLNQRRLRQTIDLPQTPILEFETVKNVISRSPISNSGIDSKPYFRDAGTFARLRNCLVNVDWKGISPIQGEILVIEDDPTLRLLMVDIVAEIGAKAVAFDAADDALTYLLEAHDRCRLVIADHGVPGQIQGIEFIELVKGRWPHIAAILTSGYLIEPATVPPSTIYLHKPWALDDLVVAVASLLQPDSPNNKP